jgi:hypothetical protein
VSVFSKIYHLGSGHRPSRHWSVTTSFRVPDHSRNDGISQADKRTGLNHGGGSDCDISA